LAAALGGGDSVGVEFAGDLAQTVASSMGDLDSLDYLLGDPPRAASARRCRARLGWAPTFGEESFELVDRDQPCAPGHLDRLDVREDAPDKGGAADAERFGGLAAGVSEPLDERRRPDDRQRLDLCRRRGRAGYAVSRATAETPFRHPNTIHEI
jgi:hypothetical protein